MSTLGFPGGSVVKNPLGLQKACNAGVLHSIPGSGRFPCKGNGDPSSILPWEIPWIEEPGGQQSMGSQRSWT